MNLQEFAALKAGDKIENHMSQSHGVVTDVTPLGVRIRWDAAGQAAQGAIGFTYTVQSTAWFHWSKVEPITAELAEDLSKRAT
jgi:hypothetical protein